MTILAAVAVGRIGSLRKPLIVRVRAWPDKSLHSGVPSMTPFAVLPNLGTTELLIIAFVSLLIFGNRLPSVMRSLGKSVTEFKKGLSGNDDDGPTAGITS